MNKKQALLELLNHVREFRDFKEIDIRKIPEFIHKPGIRMEQSNCADFLVKGFEKYVEMASENDSFVDSTDLSPDVLAYYVSFRFNRFILQNDFGVHLNLPLFLKVCKKLKWETKLPASSVIQALWEFVWAHESNHFDCDVASLIVESGNQTKLNVGRYTNDGFKCEHEESLGQTRGHAAIKKNFPKIAQAIKKMYAGMPNGYSEFNFSNNNIDSGFEEVVIHSAYQDCAQRKPSILARVILGRRKFNSKDLEVFIHYKTSSDDLILELAKPTSIRLENHAQKQLEKIYKGNKQYRKKYEKTEAMLLENPHHPSLHTRRFEGIEGHYEARIDGGDRVIFEPLDNGEFLIKGIGKDLYRH